MGIFGINCGCCAGWNLAQLATTGSPPGYEWKIWTNDPNESTPASMSRRIASSGNFWASNKRWDDAGANLLPGTSSLAGSSCDISPNGYIWGMEGGATPLRAYDETGTSLYDIAVPSDVNGPSSSSFGYGGTYSANNSECFYHGGAGGNTFNTMVVSSGGSVTQKWNMPGLTGGASVKAVRDSEDGEIIVLLAAANSDNDWLLKVDNTGTKTWGYPSDSNYTAFEYTLGGPRNSGNIYCKTIVSGITYLEVVDTSGSQVSQTSFSDSTIPLDDVDSSGNWYYCQEGSGGSIKKYNSSGTLVWTKTNPNAKASGVPAMINAVVNSSDLVHVYGSFVE